MITLTEEKFKELIEAAHRAGQHNQAHCDPSAYEAMVYYEREVKKIIIPDVDYWKQRCLLAEKCLEESHCDPDITSDQIKAWNAYHKFISWAGNDR